MTWLRRKPPRPDRYITPVVMPDTAEGATTAALQAYRRMLALANDGQDLRAGTAAAIYGNAARHAQLLELRQIRYNTARLLAIERRREQAVDAWIEHGDDHAPVRTGPTELDPAHSFGVKA